MMTVNSTDKPLGFYFNGEFISEERYGEYMKEMQSGAVSAVPRIEAGECSRCARKITGKDVMLLKDIADFEDLIQWTIPCPNCGQMVQKHELASC